MERKFALIVGNDKFEDPNLACLVSPASEARALADILKDPEIGGFDEVTALVNEPETQVRRGIASLFARKKPDDLLLLYFSTHGILDENGLLFLAAHDTQRDLLDATSVEASFVTKVMNNSSSRRQVLILDCCHSGAFARGTKGALGASVSTASAFEGNGFGRWVLTATDSTQYAWDGDKVVGGSDFSSSVFTRHLIEGLRTGAADDDDDGQISLDELYDYVYRKVLSETPRQTPGKWSYKQQGSLVLARNPYPGRKIVSLPDHLQRALESDFRPAREGAILELQRYLDGSHAGLARAAERALEKISAEDDSLKVQRLAAVVLADFRKDKPQESRPVQLEVGSGEATRTKLSRPSKPEIAQPTDEADDGPRQAMGIGPSPIEAPRDPDNGVEGVSPTTDQVSSSETKQPSRPVVIESPPAQEMPSAQQVTPTEASKAVVSPAHSVGLGPPPKRDLAGGTEGEPPTTDQRPLGRAAQPVLFNTFSTVEASNRSWFYEFRFAILLALGLIMLIIMAGLTNC